MGADAWTSGESYDAYVGRWSSRVAARFVPWLERPAGGRWLDVGCGTGALTRAVLAAAAPVSVLGVEPSEPFVRHAARRTADPRARFTCADGQALPVATASVDAVVSALVLNFLPDPAAAVTGMVRAVRPGGCVAAYVWDYAGGMELMAVFWDAVAELDPPARERHEGRRFGAWQPPVLAGLLTGAGLVEVRTTALEVPTTFRDLDDYWSPFLRGTGPAPSYVAALDSAARDRLREALRERLVPGPDGTIALSARAWAVRGQRP